MKLSPLPYISFLLLLLQYHLRAQTINDIDGNIYHTVTIGNQIWMKENLNVTHFSNGDTIPNVTENNEWLNLSTPAYCNYQNDTAMARIYGRLYNWYTIKDPRGLCPQGWMIPNDSDWSALINTLGGMNVASNKMRTSGNEWVDGGGTNSSNFSGLPAGYRYGKTGTSEGTFNALRNVGSFWSFSDTNSFDGIWWFLSLQLGGDIGIGKASRHKSYGFSVRCISLNDTLSTGLEKVRAPEMLSFYPNPGTGVFTFRNKTTSIIEIEVFDINGKMIDHFITTALEEKVLDYSLLNRGLYIICVHDGQKRSMLKFIIEK